MMKQPDDLKNRIIDNYYNENMQLDNEYHISDQSSIQEYKEKLYLSMSAMDLLKSLDYKLDINIMDIIEKAEKIKAQRKSRYELLGFIAACILILSSIVVLAFIINPKFMIYTEIVLSTLLPLVVIPISRNSKMKEEV